MICGLLRTERIACYHRVTDVSSWATRAAPAQFWGWREILVNADDLPRAREMLDTTNLDIEPTD